MIRRWLEQRRFMREHRWTGRHLNDYVDGDLNAAQQQRLERHVGLCPMCRRMLATLRDTLRALTTLRTPAPAHLTADIIDRLSDSDRS